MFRDRSEAGKKLAENLLQYKNSDAIVLALPRGGVVVGYEIAQALVLPLDVVVSRKIGHPHDPEYALCAIDGNGTFLCNEKERSLVNENWFEKEAKQQKKEALRRTALYRGKRKPAEISGKTVIITDDGIATGLTMRLAVKTVQEQKPARVIIAVPVAPADVVREIEREVDEVIVLEPPEEFLGAVGAHYEEFEQVGDNTVVRLLR